MSSESLPVLSGSIPAFELFMTQWEFIRVKYPELAESIDEGLKFANEYYKRMDNTRAYIIAMGELLWFISECM
jgi:hypothetical protein